MEDDSAVPMTALITPLRQIDLEGLELTDTLKLAAANSESLERVIENEDGNLVLAGIAEDIMADDGEIENDTDIFVPAVPLGDACEGNDDEPRRSKHPKTATSRYHDFYRH